MSRKYTEEILSGTLAYIVARIPAEITAYETKYSLAPGTIPNVGANFNLVSEDDNVFPAGLLYENPADFAIESLDMDQEKYHLSIDLADTSAELAQIRQRLYCYRDAVRNIITDNPTLGGLVLDARVVRVTPNKLFQESSNYAGLVTIDVDILTIN